MILHNHSCPSKLVKLLLEFFVWSLFRPSEDIFAVCRLHTVCQFNFYSVELEGRMKAKHNQRLFRSGEFKYKSIGSAHQSFSDSRVWTSQVSGLNYMKNRITLNFEVLILFCCSNRCRPMVNLHLQLPLTIWKYYAISLIALCCQIKKLKNDAQKC